MKEDGILVPSAEVVREAGLFLDGFMERNPGGLTDEERISFLNQLLSSLLEFPADGQCVYAFSGDDTVFVEGLRAGTTTYADIDPDVLASAKTKRPHIKTLEANLFGGLPKEFDGKVDVLVERNFCGQPTSTLTAFISSIADGGYYLLWGGEGCAHSENIAISPLEFKGGYMVVSANFSSVNIRFPDSLKEKVATILGDSSKVDHPFPWLIYRVAR